MILRSLSIFLFCTLCNLALLAQKQAKTIVDAATRQPIDFVFVSSDDKKINLLSTQEGKIIIINDNKKYFSFYKSGYHLKTILSQELNRMDSIFMERKSLTLEEVVVTSRLIDTIVKDKRFYVNDYLVLSNSEFLVLTSKINTKGFELMYYKKGAGITCLKRFKNEENEFLFRDCFNNVHLVTGAYSRQIYFTSESSFDFLPKYTREKFDSSIALCALKMNESVLFKSAQKTVTKEREYFNSVINAPLLTYSKVSNKQTTSFYAIRFNKELMEMLNSEMRDEKMIAFNTKQLGGHNISAQGREAQHELFYNQIAQKIYAPVFTKNDTVVIFNFQENAVVFLNPEGIILKQTALSKEDFPQFRNFEVICDGPQQKFYYKTKEADKATLDEINIYSGKVQRNIKLVKPFARNIQVLNGKAYYMVKENQWDDTSYLYQQNL